WCEPCLSGGKGKHISSGSDTANCGVDESCCPRGNDQYAADRYLSCWSGRIVGGSVLFNRSAFRYDERADCGVEFQYQRCTGRERTLCGQCSHYEGNQFSRTGD